MQRLADLIGMPVDRPKILETTALGAAWLAGMQSGTWPDQDGFARTWQCERRFQPTLADAQRQARLKGWRAAVRRTLAAAVSTE
jgi:glycerol kinase